MSLKQGLSYFGILLVGATAGYLVGLLTAPVSGDETRRRLSWRLDEGKSKLRRSGQKVVEETATRLERGIESGKQKLEQALSS
jgi:gas vesicle protein